MLLPPLLLLLLLLLLLHAPLAVCVHSVALTSQVMFCSPEPEHWGHDRLGFASLPSTHPSSMESYSTQDLQPYQDDLPVVDWMAALRNPSSVAVGRARNLIKTVPEPLVNANVNGDAHRDDQSEAQSLSHSLRGGGRGLQNGPGALAPSSGVSSSEESLERPPRGGGGGGVLSNLGACDPYHEGNDWCSAAVSPAESRALEIQGTEMYCSRECADRGGMMRGGITPTAVAPAITAAPYRISDKFFFQYW